MNLSSLSTILILITVGTSCFSMKRSFEETQKSPSEASFLEKVITLEDELSDAVIHNNYVRVKELLESDKPVNINAHDRDNKTPLMLAAELGHSEIAQYLIEHGKSQIDLQDQYKRTALIYAVIHERYDIVQTLLKYGASTNSKDWFGKTPLLHAIDKNNKDIVLLLLQHKADVNWDFGQWRPLERAAAVGYNEITSILIDHGAFVNPPHTFTRSALMAAALRGHKNTILLLIQKGASVTMLDSNNQSALYHAVSKGKKAAVATLLCHGASISPQCIEAAQKEYTHAGRSPEFSIFGNQEDYKFIIHLLELYQEPSLQTYCKNPEFFVHDLLSKSIQQEKLSLTTISKGCSFLMYAALCDHTTILTSLKDCSLSSVSLNARSLAGYTILDYALLGENFDFAATFITLFGALLEQVAQEGKKLLTFAVTKKAVKLVLALFKAGACPELYEKYAIQLNQLDTLS